MSGVVLSLSHLPVLHTRRSSDDTWPLRKASGETWAKDNPKGHALRRNRA